MTPQLQLMLQQAIQAFQAQNFDGASTMLKRVLMIDQKNLPALQILGLINASKSNHREAVDFLSRAAKIDPNDSSIQYNLAKVLQDCNLYKESVPHHKKAVHLAPNNLEAWLNYGVTVSHLGLYDEAISYFDKAIELNTNYAEAYLNKGAALKELRRYDEALVFFERALLINPRIAQAWNNKGVILKDLKQYEAAIAQYDAALTLNPSLEEVWLNKANALIQLKHNNDAIHHYERALSLNPNIDWVFGDLIHAKMKICCWHGLDSNLLAIFHAVLSGKKIAAPFHVMALVNDPLLLKRSSEIYAFNKYQSNLNLGKIIKRPKKEKIRIGYFSADFHNHATGFLMAELFEIHNKEQFELIGFSFGPQYQDEIRHRLVNAFDQFIEVGNKSDIEIAKLSRNLEIDIAIDLKGFTDDSRPGIFAYRAAPIQVNYLGYPGTIGADYIDYIIADKILIPLDCQAYYSEKVVYLPDSYQANDRNRVISDRQFTKLELGLPENKFIFCCFNNNFKILPETFAGWMRILKAVEGSVLWLYQDNPWVVENLTQEALSHGVEPIRLVFAQQMLLSDHLARHRHADLFLDTFPCNAHTTASDALWAELPVLTLAGKSFASRVAASLLNAIGLPELVTSTQLEYEALAIDLGSSPEKLALIKDKLKQNRLKTPLFDTPLFAKNLEATYLQMYDRYQADLPVAQISISG